ncbi:RNA-directed DNA polymerase from mobile element jockey-like [Brachionus plicatilis]|uniref:RNA-directed DNA polymerase from mobile element jockey-like n=1 Tax=Brachionus plicatilis TaxID=10195 RepID=A0A3M7PT73_BRAPC|nr:RNA-directed DNA polymerase from mobile element jockey-like [Brachionus plicatilis]
MKTTIPSSPNQTVQQLNVQFKTKPLNKTRLGSSLSQFLAKKCPDIVLLNELKIDLSEANIYLDFHSYQFITKPRNKYGGGVAILIKEGIEFIQDFSYEEFNSELLCIKTNLGKNNELFVFSLYNPPNVLLNFEFFKTVVILTLEQSKIGCVGENENGIMLERIINELDFSVINDKRPTFNIFNGNYFEILDLFLVSSSLIDKITDFCVLNSQDMTGDNFPIEASISMGLSIRK